MLVETAAITGILILATLTESLVEYLVAPLVDHTDGSETAEYWRVLGLRYIAAAVGMIFCVVYRADLLAMLGLVSPWPWVGWVVTGLLIGRGANFIHDFASRWLGTQLR